MQTGFWLASAATAAIVTVGVGVASPIVYGQADDKRSRAEAPQPPATASETHGDAEAAAEAARGFQDAVRKALESAGLADGRFNADVRRAVEEATRAAQEAVRDIDVDVLVDDAMQGLPDVAPFAGRPRIGVSTRDVTAEEATAAGLDGITGAYVTDVAGDSPAGRAGLQAKDIIVSVDGETIRSARQLARVIAESPDGRALAIAYVRDKTRASATVTLETRSLTRRGREDRGPVVRRFERRVVPPRPGVEGRFDMYVPRAPGDGMRLRVGRGRLGVMAQPLTPQLATYFGVEDGVLVTQVNEDSPAAKAGIKAGDVITAVNGKPVKSPGEIFEQLRDGDAGKSVPIQITRDRKSQTLHVTLPAPTDSSEEQGVTPRHRFTA